MQFGKWICHNFEEMHKKSVDIIFAKCFTLLCQSLVSIWFLSNTGDRRVSEEFKVSSYLLLFDFL